MAKKCNSKEKIFKEDRALYPIGVVSEMLGMSDQTLRLYEKHGLITPKRKNNHRYYSDNDIKWLKCIKAAIHKDKISIEGLKKLLNYAPCWEIRGCNDYIKQNCQAYISKKFECWSLGNCSTGDVRCQRCIIKKVSCGVEKPK